MEVALFQRRIKSLRRGLRDIPLFSVVFLSLIVMTGIFGPYFVPHNPEESDLSQYMLPLFWMKGGSMSYPLGTDHLGRDVLSRLVVGARISLLVGFVAVFFSGFIGTVVAIVSGYLGGWVDAILMRLTDAMLSMPYLLIGVALAAVLGPGLFNLVIVLAVLGWSRYARILRSEVLRLKELDFVVMARITGCSTGRIIWRHIFTNIVNTMVVLATLQLGVTIILAASLSFLGMGVSPPTPEWGLMVAEGRDFLDTAWWLSTFPGLSILMTCLGANLLGDWLRLRLDPKYRQRA